MARKTSNTKGFSGDTAVVHEIYDGDKYKEDVFVCVNGKPFLIKRGMDVQVPAEVAEVLRNRDRQDNKTRRLIEGLKGREVEIPYMR